MKKLLCILLCCIPLMIHARGTDSLRSTVKNIITSFKGDVGFSMKHLERGDTVSFNGYRYYPMQSVFKFPLSLAALYAVDKGILKLDSGIFIPRARLLPNTWSPIREKYPKGDITLTLREIIQYTVSQSDNNGCDILFHLLGGPGRVNLYIKSLGIQGMQIVANEEDMHKDWNLQFDNYSSPLAMTQLFETFFRNGVLSEDNRQFLWQTLKETMTGPKRLKGLLPAGTVAGHKTGSSGVQNGITAACNDAGIIMLPGDNHVVITVFVSNTKESTDAQEKVIARLAKAVWDFYTS